jgi:salicylate hydroxylase
MISVSNVFFI